MDEEGLQHVVEGIGISLRDAQSWELLFHLDAVLKANEQLNLTAIRDRDEAVKLHILDSLTAVSPVAGAPVGRIADIGSGAGFPGIPLAIALDRPTTLIESRSRKAAFLGAIATALDHDIDVAAVRAEELALERRGEYAAITARAVAPLAALVELAAPLLVSQGRFVAMKGDPDGDERAAGEMAAARVGLTLTDVRTPTIPGLDAARTIYVYERTHEAEVELPRRAGMAQKRPLS